MCLRACRSSARFTTEHTVPSKDLFPSLLGGSLAPPLPLPRPPARQPVASLPGVIVPRASQESTPRWFQNWSHFRTPFLLLFYNVWNILSVLFVSFFALGGDLGEAAFLKDLPSEIADFKGATRPRTLPKRSPEESSKKDPKKDMKFALLGDHFGSLGGLLSDFWGCLGAPCHCLAASWAKKVEKGRPRPAQESPKEHWISQKSSPREAQQGQEGPRETPRSLREAQEAPKRGPKDSQRARRSPRKYPRPAKKASRQ